MKFRYAIIWMILRTDYFSEPIVNDGGNWTVAGVDCALILVESVSFPYEISKYVGQKPLNFSHGGFFIYLFFYFVLFSQCLSFAQRIGSA